MGRALILLRAFLEGPRPSDDLLREAVELLRDVLQDDGFGLAKCRAKTFLDRLTREGR